MKKKKIVENDKQKIMATIRELDEKKNEALKKAWSQVNKVNTKAMRESWSLVQDSRKSKEGICCGTHCVTSKCEGQYDYRPMVLTQWWN